MLLYEEKMVRKFQIGLVGLGKRSSTRDFFIWSIQTEIGSVRYQPSVSFKFQQLKIVSRNFLLVVRFTGSPFRPKSEGFCRG